MVDLIIPCYNPPPGWEKELVFKLRSLITNYFNGKKEDVHLILVNDGSTVNFSDVEIGYLEATGLSIDILHNTENRGKGYSVRKGVAHSTAPFCIFTDIDFPFGIDSIHGLLTKLLLGADIAIGVRNKFHYFRNASPARKRMSLFLMFINRKILQLPYEDTQSGVKGLNQIGKEILLETTINRFLFDLEFMLLANSCDDIKISPLPVNYNSDSRLTKFSSFTVMQESVNFLKLICNRKYVQREKKHFAWDRS